MGGENIDSLFWSNLENYLISLKNEEKYTLADEDWWGAYKIKGDSIFIQYFFTKYDSFIRRDIIELHGVINGNTISIIKAYCKWCHQFSPRWFNESGIKYYDPIPVFKFYPTSFKPDSTNAEFYNKKWYKNELHDSRK